jgi:biotin carboxylase
MLTVDSKSDGAVLLVGSGMRPYREYLMQGAGRAHPLWLLDHAPASWQLPYLAGSTVVELLDADRLVPDLPRLVAAAEELARQHRIAGVFTYDEILVMATSHIADRLGVPGFRPDSADRCRNKHRSRMTLAAAGLRQPRFELVHTAAEAARAAETLGYPVVVKPRGMAASIGVGRANGRTELQAAFVVAERLSHSGPPAYEGGALVEELVVGPEISVDGAVSGGDYRPFCLARKQVGFHPYFEETGHVVDGADPLLGGGGAPRSGAGGGLQLDPELMAVLVAAHRALGLRDGMTHTELRLTEHGPVIIEVNARLGGDLIPRLGQLATGVDPGRIAADVATGRPPRTEPSKAGSAAIRFVYPPEDCRVVAATVPEPGAVPGLVEARAMASPGTRLRLPPRAHLGRYGYLICTADDPAECEARLDAAAKLADVHYEPLEPAQAHERPW